MWSPAVGEATVAGTYCGAGGQSYFQGLGDVPLSEAARAMFIISVCHKI